MGNSPTSGTSVNCSSLKIVTFNVWFDSYMIRERFELLVAELESHKPDIICFQEVTPKFLQWCHDAPFFHDYHQCYKSSETKKVIPYGCLIVSRFPIASFQELELTTMMFRKCLILEVILNDKRVLIGNVHLESLNTAKVRACQLKDIFATLGPCPNAFFMGDLNIGEVDFMQLNNQEEYLRNGGQNLSDLATSLMRNGGTVPENAQFARYPDWSDSWKILHPNDYGFTFDTVKNLMLNRIDPQYTSPHPYNQSRYDRIFYKCTDFVPVSVTIIGDKPTTKKDANGQDVSLFCSDHFGLLLEMKYTGPAVEEESKK